MRFVALEQVAKIDRKVATEDECATLPYIGLEHIGSNSGHLITAFTGNPESLLASKFRFTSKHVLYGKLRPYLNKVALPTFNGVCTTEILPLLPSEEVLDRTYLWAILISPNFVSWASANTSGANLPRLDPDLLKTYQLPLPPLPEQKRIATILEKADRLRRLRRYALELSSTYLQAVFLEMFKDAENKFEIVTIEDIASQRKYALSSGPFGSNLTSAHYSPQGVIILRGLNISGSELNLDDVKYVNEEKALELSRSEVRPGDIVVVAVGSSGLACQIPATLPRAIMSQNFNKITPDLHKIDPTFLEYIINSRAVQKQLYQEITDTVRTFLSLTKLKSIKIPLPPLSLQQKFAAIVQKYKHLRSQQREALRQAEHLFQTLLHQTFEGELEPMPASSPPTTELENTHNTQNLPGIPDTIEGKIYQLSFPVE